jgi:N-sulfoglucosamine sulfohydrolase
MTFYFMMWRKVICLIVLSAWITAGWAQKKENVAKPNILWITCEDMSPDLPAFGDSTVSTPNLDRLAAEGIRYTHLFSVSGVCAPSRSAIITGMYPTSIGTHHMRTGSGARAGFIDYQAVPPPEVKCFPEYLRPEGYYCTNNSKTDYQFGNPFTAWDENSNKAHWRNRRKGQPFFSVFNIMRTHESQVWEHKDKPLRVDPARVPLPPYYPESPVIRRDIARNYDNIMVMDSIVGTIMRQLEEDGLLENTIVFFFSDHGSGLPWYKREVYDRGLRAPMIVRFPNRQDAGAARSELISFIDLAPTVLSLAGVSVPGYMQGQAFLGDNKAKQPRQYIFAARDRMDEHYDLVRAVRDERFKYIRNYQPDKPNYQDLAYRRQMNLMQEILRLKEEGKLNAVQSRWFENKPVEELYDTQADPYELQNLAGNPQYQADLERLRQAEGNWLRQMRDKGFMPEAEMVASMWPDNKQPVTETPHIQQLGKKGKEVLLQITSSTPGASVAYKVGKGPWLLTNGKPITLPAGVSVAAKAIRYGYRESPESSFQ